MLTDSGCLGGLMPYRRATRCIDAMRAAKTRKILIKDSPPPCSCLRLWPSSPWAPGAQRGACPGPTVG